MPEQQKIAQDFAMSDFLLTLVLQIKSSKIINDMAKVQIKSERITPFWRNFFKWESNFPLCRSGYRQNTGASMYVIRLPVRRDCRFAGKCLLLWRWLRGGRYEPPDAPLKSHCGLRGMEYRIRQYERFNYHDWHVQALCCQEECYWRLLADFEVDHAFILSP